MQNFRTVVYRDTGVVTADVDVWLCVVCWQTRDELLRENEELRGRIELQGEQLSAMRAHMGVIRQHTIAFILDQMDTLHMQRDTAVWRRA